MLLKQDLIATLVLLAVAIPSAAPFLQAFLECVQINGATEAELVVFVRSGEASGSVKCTFHCHSDYYHVIGADGRFNMPKLKGVLPDNAHNIAEKCGNFANAAPDSADPCEISYRFHKCFLETDHQLYLTVEEV